MRLINVDTLEMEEFKAERPRYAILSHRWGDDEITFQQFTAHENEDSEGYLKVQQFCRYVREHQSEFFTSRFSRSSTRKIEWVWVDTCCIDKSSSAELHEAINSMWKWYQGARACVVHLADVRYSDLDDKKSVKAFRRSSWFSRGWTLQELLAPSRVHFVNKKWEDLGKKVKLKKDSSQEERDFMKLVSKAAGIPLYYLDPKHTHNASFAQRMSWASARETSREEDIAYCLMGLLDVHMSCIYGEGLRKAFYRLQKAFIEENDDESVFAWTFDEDNWDELIDEKAILAHSPAFFRFAHSLKTITAEDEDYVPRGAFSITNKGLQVQSPAHPLRIDSRAPRRFRKSKFYEIDLNCYVSSDEEDKRCEIILEKVDGNNTFTQWHPNVLKREGVRFKATKEDSDSIIDHFTVILQEMEISTR